MIASLIAYVIVGLITWIGVIAQVTTVNRYVWRLSDAHSVVVTLVATVVMWPFAFAWWQRCQWRKEAGHA